MGDRQRLLANIFGWKLVRRASRVIPR
jgi:hypothetical protein